MDNLTVVEHPLLQRTLTQLRRKDTAHGAFREAVADASGMLAYEALRSAAVTETEIETPLESTTGYEIADDIVVAPIMRAGLGMVDGVFQHVPEARVAHLGMQRDEETHTPVSYYRNIPPGIAEAHTVVVDPMLATGGSAHFALNTLRDEGAEQCTFVCLVAAPEGVQRLGEEHPNVPVITAALDRELDENAFIRPGLGDAGDRIYGTT